MKISAITVCYNSESTIRHTLDSFFGQTHPEKEIVIIDGASSDRTVDIIKEYSCEALKLLSEPDNGIYDAMNKGLRRVSGDAFGCLNSDDCYARPDALALIADALKDADVVSGRLHFVREHDGSAPVRKWYPELHRPGAYARGFSLPHPTTYARRTVLERVGEFSTEYRCASDYDWLMRALEIEGFSHAIIDEVLVNMRIGGESTAGLRAIWQNSRELLEIRQKRLDSGVLDVAMFLNFYKKFKQRAGH